MKNESILSLNHKGESRNQEDYKQASRMMASKSGAMYFKEKAASLKMNLLNKN